VRQFGVFGRINAVMAAGQHRDRSRCQGGPMGDSVDPARQAGDHREAGVGQITCEHLCELRTGR
jgi:hypothetical protein